jgi:hypothetical protein
MSRRVRTEETSLWITFESLTFFPLLVCRGVWERRKPHYGSHSSLSLSSLYWYVAACENGGNFTTDHIRVSHFLPFTGMSRRVRTGETSLRITFESLTFFPLLVCRGVWELRKLHYGSHSSLSLSSLYWYVAACENWGNLTTDHIRVSHFLPFTGMSRRVRTEETSLRITFESLTFFPLLVCCSVWELRKLHYGSHSSNLMS